VAEGTTITTDQREIQVDAPLVLSTYTVRLAASTDTTYTVTIALFEGSTNIRNTQLGGFVKGGDAAVFYLQVDVPLETIYYTLPVEESGGHFAPPPEPEPQPEPEPEPGGGLTPLDFLASCEKPTGYGPYGNDISTWMHDAFGILLAKRLGVEPYQPAVSELGRYTSAGSDDESLYRAYLAALAIGQGSGFDAAGPQLQSQYMRIRALEALGQSVQDASLAAKVVAGADGSGNQNPDGGFEAVPIGSDLYQLDGFERQRSCVWRTAMAIYLLTRLAPGQYDDEVSMAATYLASAQNPDGGWGYEEGRPSDMRQTWFAVQGLLWAGRQVPANTAEWVLSCQNPDGGFGDRPGWDSRLEATLYAVDILASMGRDSSPAATGQRERPSWFDDPDMKVYYYATQTYAGNYPGARDFVSLAVDAAQRQGISLISGKYGYKIDLTEQGNDFASTWGIPVECAVGDEVYTFKLQYNGWRWHDHSLVYIHRDGDSGPYAPYRRGTTVGNTFDEFARSNAGYLQHGVNGYQLYDSFNPFGAIDVLDASIDVGGYNAFVASGIYSRDFVRQMPWLEKYLGHLVPLSQYDNHHTFENGIGYAARHVGFFIAKNGGWDGFWDAVQNGRTGIVFSSGVIWGSRDVIDWARAHGVSTRPLISACSAPIVESISDLWGKYSWETWQGGIAIRVWGSVTEVRIDGEPQQIEWHTKEECSSDSGKPAKYLTDYGIVQRPDLTSGQHVIEVVYTEGGEAKTEKWIIDPQAAPKPLGIFSPYAYPASSRFPFILAAAGVAAIIVARRRKLL